MSRPEFTELGRKLLSRGYAPGYVRRLIGELSDHWECCEEESRSSKRKDSRIDQRLGDSNLIVEAIESRVELDPLVRRFPIHFFALVPLLLLIGGQVAALLAAKWLVTWSNVAANGELSAHVFEWLVFLFPVAISSWGSWLGLRHAIQCDWIFLAAFVMSISSFSTIEINNCDATSHAYFRQTWHFGISQFLLILTPALLALAIKNWQFSKAVYQFEQVECVE